MLQLIIGNISFHHFSDEELKLFKTDSEKKALVHSIECIVECEDEQEAHLLGEESLGVVEQSYVILGVFKGEIAYDCSNNLRPIDSNSFRKEYL